MWSSLPPIPLWYAVIPPHTATLSYALRRAVGWRAEVFETEILRVVSGGTADRVPISLATQVPNNVPRVPAALEVPALPA